MKQPTYDELARRYEQAVSALDHMLSDAVSRPWRLKWPQQHTAMVRELERHRQILRATPGTVAFKAQEKASA